MTTQDTNTQADLQTTQDNTPAPSQEGTWEGVYARPEVDIYERAEGLTLVADLPGVKGDDIHIDLEQSLLTITARAGKQESRWRAIHEEFQATHYTRQFRLGRALDQSKIEAKFEDGVLTLHMPRVASQQPRKITVS